MFTFAAPGQLRFGRGVAREAAAAIAQMGRRVLLVRGQDPDRATWLREDLRALGLEVEELGVYGEPTFAGAREALAHARSARTEVVVALGGGSPLDMGKAVAALAPQPRDLMTYVEVVGAGEPLEVPSLPFVALPTTAGTGSEVTRNAVLTDPERRVKVSLRSPWMLPALALVDPLLTLGLPTLSTAACGLDALTQVLEPFVSPAASPLTDGFCREALDRAGWALPRVVADGSDLEAREAMALVSVLGGLALGNARLGVVHAFAAPLGGLLEAPHGILCARLLPEAWEVNVAALQREAPGHPALARYQEAARRLTGDPEATAESGSRWLQAFVTQVGMPRLADLGLAPHQEEAICAQARRANSMKGNPLELSDADLRSILERAR